MYLTMHAQQGEAPLVQALASSLHSLSLSSSHNRLPCLPAHQQHGAVCKLDFGTAVCKADNGMLPAQLRASPTFVAGDGAGLLQLPEHVPSIRDIIHYSRPDVGLQHAQI